MKHILFFLTLFLNFNAFAQVDMSMGRGTYENNFPGVAAVKIQVLDIGEGYDVLNVSVKCEDKRSKKNVVKPDWEKVPALNERAICLHRYRKAGDKEPTFDKAKNLINVHYSESTIRPDGHFECNVHTNYELKLIDWCQVPWRN